MPHGALKSLLLITPVIEAAFMYNYSQHFIDSFFRNEEVPLWLLIFGSMGQIIFTLRFVYQWAYSFHHKESLLPAGFWIISLVGSSVIVAYGVFRLDPVLILGQSVGFVAYFSTILIGPKSSKQSVAYEK